MIELEKEIKNLNNSLFNMIEQISRLNNEYGLHWTENILREEFPFHENLTIVAHKVRKWHQKVEEKTALYEKFAEGLPGSGDELDQMTVDAIFYPIKIQEATVNIEMDGKLTIVPFKPSQNIAHTMYTINVTLREKGYKVQTDINLLGWEVHLISPAGIKTSVVAGKLEEALCHALILNVDAENTQY